MSKQSDAKKSQEYRIEPLCCASCKHFCSDLVPIKWMVDRNKEYVAAGRAEPYDLTRPTNLKEGNLRCGIGGFAVKKTACCKLWEEVVA